MAILPHMVRRIAIELEIHLFFIHGITGKAKANAYQLPVGTVLLQNTITEFILTYRKT
jgi:hypothetical protein